MRICTQYDMTDAGEHCNKMDDYRSGLWDFLNKFITLKPGSTNSISTGVSNPFQMQK